MRPFVQAVLDYVNSEQIKHCRAYEKLSAKKTDIGYILFMVLDAHKAWLGVLDREKNLGEKS